MKTKKTMTRRVNDHMKEIMGDSKESEKSPRVTNNKKPFYNVYFKNKKSSIDKIVSEYKKATPYEIWEGIRDNFVFGFIGAMLVVFIATRTDVAVLLGYFLYYSFMGKIVNRPKYVTDLGKLIVFPIPSALGAFAGYKASYILLHLI
jgi:hypothetical protein